MTNDEYDAIVARHGRPPTELERFGWPLVIASRIIGALILAVFAYGVFVGATAVWQFFGA